MKELPGCAVVAAPIVLLLLLYSCLPSGVRMMRKVHELRNLPVEEITRIEFVELAERNGQHKRVFIADPEAIRSIAEALGDTSPYSPNHEGIVAPWKAVVHYKDGRELRFRIGKGNSVYSDTIWIDFELVDGLCEGSYQNPSLPKALNGAGFGPWSGSLRALSDAPSSSVADAQ